MKRMTPLLVLLAGLAAFPGWAATVVTANYQTSQPFIIDTASDLILNLLPTVVGDIGTTTPYSLVDGQAPGQIADDWPNNNIRNGCVLTWDMGAPATINEIRTYTAWVGNGRAKQDYTVDVSADGVVWNTGVIQVVNGGGAAPDVVWCDVEVIVANDDATPLATNARYIRFNFPSVQNGAVGYSEFVVNGVSAGTPAPPVFTTDPKSQTVTNGDTVRFTAAASGFPPPLITWHYVDGNNNDTTLSTVGSPLVIKNIKLEQAGDYYAVASNGSGSVNSSSVHLTVVKGMVTEVDYNVNSPFEGLRGNDLLQGNPGVTSLNNFDTQGGWAPVNLTDGNVGTPTCISGGSAAYPYTLIGNNGVVTYDLGGPCSITGVETWTGWNGGGRDNQNYTFSYSMDGVNFTNMWTVANEPNQPHGNDVWLQVEGLSNVVAVSFKFNLQQNGGVAYTELAVYGISSVVAEPPVFTVDPQSQTATTGDTVIFTAEATGTPVPLIAWHFVDSNGNDTVLSAVGSTLTLKRVALTQTGDYYAAASNAGGSVNSAMAHLDVIQGPVVETDYNSNTPFAGMRDTDLIQGNMGISNLRIGEVLGGWTVAHLTDGNVGSPTCISGGSPAYPYGLIGNDGSITYELASPSTVTGVETWTGWNGGGRDNQNYTFSYSQDGVNFVDLYTVQNEPNVGFGNDVYLQISELTDVLAVRFTFGNQQNGGVAYTELAVYGTSGIPNDPPWFIMDPLDQTVTAGDTVTFQVDVEGFPTPVVNWHFVDANNVDTQLAAIGETLTLSKVSLGQAGDYYAVASNPAGTATSVRAHLTVEKGMVNEVDINVNAPFAGIRENNLIQGNAGISALRVGETTGGWTPARLTDGDVGSPTCVSGGSAAYPYGLIGNYGSITYDLGGPCTITGVETWTGWNGGGRDNQDYTFSYSTDGENFTDLWTVQNEPNMNFGNDVWLQINNLQDVVAVRFTFGSQQNGGVAYTELAVYGTSSIPPKAPEFTVLPESRTVTNSYSVTFTAEASGYPPPLITWHFVNAFGNDHVLPVTGSTLTIANVDIQKDAGEYYAVASSSAGTNASPKAKLTIASNGVLQTSQGFWGAGGTFTPITGQEINRGLSGISALTTYDAMNGWTTDNLSDGEINSPGGVGGASGGTYGGIGRGTITYDLGGGSKGLGFDITGIESWTSWWGGGRVNQNYLVSYSQDGANFIPLQNVYYDGDGNCFGTDVALSISGLKNVWSVRFDFSGSQQNGWVVYTELAIYGEPSTTVPGITITRSGEDLVLTWQGGGVLQYSYDVNGPYTDIPEAVSPWTIYPMDAQGYYRVMQP